MHRAMAANGAPRAQPAGGAAGHRRARRRCACRRSVARARLTADRGRRASGGSVEQQACGRATTTVCSRAIHLTAVIAPASGGAAARGAALARGRHLGLVLRGRPRLHREGVDGLHLLLDDGVDHALPLEQLDAVKALRHDDGLKLGPAAIARVEHLLRGSSGRDGDVSRGLRRAPRERRGQRGRRVGRGARGSRVRNARAPRRRAAARSRSASR